MVNIHIRSAWKKGDWLKFAWRNYGVQTSVVDVDAPEAKEEGPVPAEADDLRQHFEERSAILEHDAGLPRPEAEAEATRITATYARNKGHLWSSLRSALSDYPALLSEVPNRAGKVDRLPWGVATLAVLKDKRVVRQGIFSGPPHVTKEDQRR